MIILIAKFVPYVLPIKMYIISPTRERSYGSMDDMKTSMLSREEQEKERALLGDAPKPILPEPEAQTEITELVESQRVFGVSPEKTQSTSTPEDELMPACASPLESFALLDPTASMIAEREDEEEEEPLHETETDVLPESASPPVPQSTTTLDDEEVQRTSSSFDIIEDDEIADIVPEHIPIGGPITAETTTAEITTAETANAETANTETTTAETTTDETTAVGGMVGVPEMSLEQAEQMFRTGENTTGLVDHAMLDDLFKYKQQAAYVMDDMCKWSTASTCSNDTIAQQRVFDESVAVEQEMEVSDNGVQEEEEALPPVPEQKIVEVVSEEPLVGQEQETSGEITDAVVPAAVVPAAAVPAVVESHDESKVTEVDPKIVDLTVKDSTASIVDETPVPEEVPVVSEEESQVLESVKPSEAVPETTCTPQADVIVEAEKGSSNEKPLQEPEEAVVEPVEKEEGEAVSSEEPVSPPSDEWIQVLGNESLKRRVNVIFANL